MEQIHFSFTDQVNNWFRTGEKNQVASPLPEEGESFQKSEASAQDPEIAKGSPVITRQKSVVPSGHAYSVAPPSFLAPAGGNEAVQAGSGEAAPDPPISREDFFKILSEMGSKRSRGELSPEITAKGLVFWGKKLAKQADPLLTAIHQRLVYHILFTDNRTDGLLFENFNAENPQFALTHFFKHARFSSRDLAFYGDADALAGYLRKIDADTSQGKIPEDLLKTMAHLGSRLYWQKNVEKCPDVKTGRPGAYEPIAQGCAYLIDTWWKRGQIEIRAKGTPLPPGSVDVADIIQKNYVAVRGSGIELGEWPQQKVSDEIDDKAYMMIDPNGVFEKNSRDNAEELKELCKKDKNQAGELVGAVIEGLHPTSTHRDIAYARAAQLLEQTYRNPEVKELFVPWLDVISAFPGEAEARDTLDNNTGLIDLCKSLNNNFPETLDRKFVTSALGPLLRSRNYQMAEKLMDYLPQLWEKHPALVVPCMEELFGDWKEPVQDENTLKLMNMAIEKYGWLPDSRQCELIASGFSATPHLRVSPILNKTDQEAKGCREALKLFSAIDGIDHRILDETRLPGLDGNPVTVRQAMLERVFSDPLITDYLRAISQADRPWRILESAVILNRENSQTIDNLLQALEQALSSPSGESSAGSPDRLSPYHQGALAFLCAASLNPEQSQRFHTLMKTCLYEKQSVENLRTIVNGERARETASLMEKITGGSLTAGQGLEALSSILVMCYCSAERAGENPRSLKSTADEVYRGLALLKKEKGYGEALDSLYSEVETEYNRLKSEGGGLDSPLTGFRLTADTDDEDVKRGPYMDLHHLARLHVLIAASREDATLREHLKILLNDDLFIEHKTLRAGEDGDMVLQELRDILIEVNNKSLAETTMGRKERVMLMTKNSFLDPGIDRSDGRDLKQETWTTFREGLTRSAFLKDMPAYIEDDNRLNRLYISLAPDGDSDEEIAPAWENFRRLMESLGGKDQFDQTVNAYRFVEKKVAAGIDRNAAIEHVLICLSLGQDYGEVPIKGGEEGRGAAKVEVLDDDELSLDGVRLKINSAERRKASE